MTVIHTLAWDDLPPRTAYAVLRLRVDVFVVEQECPYPELDGRDLEPGALHVVATDGDDVVGTLRVLTDPDGGSRIGRVCVAASARGSGLAARLMEAAHAVTGESPTVLDAQAHLQHWYARFGYAAASEEFLEDGIPHVTMRRSLG
ncbi:GNAT family N-acetyltransferase [Solicola sp. PLA-1-18]|uniref:GNAT family N-acetyltransferase n=1 Tax=Solicola sp. PLA-1-18 TaxID=3380532 RepID=UPI003B79139B